MIARSMREFHCGRFDIRFESVEALKRGEKFSIIEIKAGESVELKPGSLHAMFVGVKEPLETGRSIKGTLTFEKAGTVEIEYAVRPIGPSAASGGHTH